MVNISVSGVKSVSGPADGAPSVVNRHIHRHPSRQQLVCRSSCSRVLRHQAVIMLFHPLVFWSLLLVADLVVCGRRTRNGNEVSKRYATEEGVVGAGNYTYYTLEAPSEKSIVITIRLHSVDGDADLYVAGNNKKATFDVEGHSFQSASCGDDVVVVPSHFVRESSPVVIGIYGHPRFNVSKYYLEVVWEPETNHELDKNSYDDDDEHPVSREEDMDPETESDNWQEFLKNAFLQLLRLLFEVLMS